MHQAHPVWLQKYTPLYQYWSEPLVDTVPEGANTHPDFLLIRSNISFNKLKKLELFLKTFNHLPWYKKWFADKKEYFAIPYIEEFLFWHPIVARLTALPQTIVRTDAASLKRMEDCITGLSKAQNYFKLYKEAKRLAIELDSVLKRIRKTGSCSYTDNLNSSAWQILANWLSSFRQNKPNELNQPLLSQQPRINGAGIGLNPVNGQTAPAIK